MELIKSMIRFPLAMSAFGAQQIMNFVKPEDRSNPARRTEASIYSVARATQSQFDDAVWAAYTFGDEVQRDMVDLMMDMVTLRAFKPRNVARMTSDLAQQTAEATRVFVPGKSNRLAIQQLKNNYEVFNLVKNVHVILNIPRGGEYPLKRSIDKCYSLGGYPDLWAVEGLGHDYADSFIGHGEPIRNILTNAKAEVLPAKSLTMMHAGIGLSFAWHLLDTVTPYSPPVKIREMVKEFATLCRENSRPGYEGAAYESLGLVTRTWHSQMVPFVDERLAEVEPELVSYFWRGVGRAFYFMPLYIAPGFTSPWRAVDREPPHQVGRHNARAGLAWATTMVNIKHPGIVENLIKYRGDQLAADDSFSNGVVSSIIMRQDTTPDICVKEFVSYRPDASNARLVKHWDQMIKRPCELALQRYHDVLRRNNQLGQIFHYQNLDALVQRLENTEKTTSTQPS